MRTQVECPTPCSGVGACQPALGAGWPESKTANLSNNDLRDSGGGGCVGDPCHLLGFHGLPRAGLAPCESDLVQSAGASSRASGAGLGFFWEGRCGGQPKIRLDVLAF